MMEERPCSDSYSKLLLFYRSQFPGGSYWRSDHLAGRGKVATPVMPV